MVHLPSASVRATPDKIKQTRARGGLMHGMCGSVGFQVDLELSTTILSLSISDHFAMEGE